MSADQSGPDDLTHYMQTVSRYRESLEFVTRPLAFNSSNGYQSCQNCGNGWFPADGEAETHDPRCPHVVLGGES